MDRFEQTKNIDADRLLGSASSEHKVRYHSLNFLLLLLFGDKEKVTSSGSSLLSQGSLRQGYGGSYSSQYYFHEEESTSFQTTGTAVTADGRELNFNLDQNAASVSDQKFLFDLDADGNSEMISMLGSGSGFLALDKNGDGVINDGSELFGTKNGDGRNHAASGSGTVKKRKDHLLASGLEDGLYYFIKSRIIFTGLDPCPIHGYGLPLDFLQNYNHYQEVWHLK